MQTSIGSVRFGDLSQKISNLKLLPDSISLTTGQQNATVALAELGIRKDVSRTTKSAKQQRSWLPIANLFTSPELHAPVTFDDQQLEAKTTELAAALRQDAANARINLEETSVGISESKDGYELDRAAFRQAIISYFDRAKKQRAITVPTIATKPTVTSASLAPQKADLENQLKTAVTYTFNAKTRQATAAEIASWYVPAGDTYAPSTEKIQAYIAGVGTGFGIRVKDSASLAATTKQNLTQKQPTTATLVQQVAAKTFTYCIAAKGVDTSYLGALRSKLKESYGSSRGWSVGNLVEYTEVTSGCNFTVWLAAANVMPTFGAICDSMWSCRVGANVVINFDRWQNASPAWNANGGTLDEYRHMVINHETGHWLGFGHDRCGGAGQPAPVMQQQSIDLQGCTFSAWPSSSEIAVLRRTLGI